MKRTLGISLLAIACANAAAQPASGAKELFFGNDGGMYRINEKKEAGESATSDMVSRDATAGESKKVVQAAKPRPAKAAAAPKHLGLIASVVLVGDGNAARKVSPNTVFKAGDVIQLALRPNRPGYLYVVNIGSTGRHTVLFPRNGSKENFVEAFQEYIVPTRMKFDANPGIEQIIVALSPTPQKTIRTTDYANRLVVVSTEQEGRGHREVGENRIAAAPVAAAVEPAPVGHAPLVLADMGGSKDLVFDESDGPIVVASAQAAPEVPSQVKPLVLNLKLNHQ